ncbi:hypothetical protein JMUB7473_27470 [Staphylococcus aureus]
MCIRDNLIRTKKKSKPQQKEPPFTTRQSNPSKFKASDLDKTTDQSTQRMTHEELRVDNQDDPSPVSLNG